MRKILLMIAFLIGVGGFALAFNQPGFNPGNQCGALANCTGVVTGGNVSIGTTSSLNTLDVHGNAAIGADYAGQIAAAPNGLLVESNTGIGTTLAGDLLQVGSTGGIGLRVNSAGNISAIGGTTNASLTSGTLNITSTAATMRNSSATAGSNLTISGGASATSFLNLRSTTGVGTTDSVNIVLGSAGSINGLIVQDNGTAIPNVGIGTFAPQATLQVGSSLAGSQTAPGSAGFNNLDIHTSGSRSSVEIVQTCSPGGVNAANCYGLAVSAGLSTAQNTGTVAAIESFPRVTAAAVVTTASGFIANNCGATGGGSITNCIGYNTQALSTGTNNYGFQGILAAGANNYNAYMSGTAQNYFAGNIGIGSLTPGVALDVVGTVRISTGTVGQAVCFKSDKSLGQCTSGVGVGGACTCT